MVLVPHNGPSEGGKGGANTANTELAVVPPAPRVQLNAQSLGMLVDSIDRSRNAVSSAMVMFNKAAGAFSVRATACTQASSQLQEEHAALTAAKDCIVELQRRIS